MHLLLLLVLLGVEEGVIILFNILLRASGLVSIGCLLLFHGWSQFHSEGTLLVEFLNWDCDVASDGIFAKEAEGLVLATVIKNRGSFKVTDATLLDCLPDREEKEVFIVVDHGFLVFKHGWLSESLNFNTEVNVLDSELVLHSLHKS